MSIIFIAAVNADAQFSSPRAVVFDLYQKHNAKHSPFWQKKSRELVDHYFTKELADLIWKDAHGPDDEAPILDGDPLYNAQDMEIKAFKIGIVTTNGNSAKVPVTFTNFGKRQEIKFSLKRVGANWKISNIIYDNNESLMQWLTEAAK